jgi:hypothetical protein
LKRVITLFFVSLFFINTASAQKITGTWEGDIDGDEYLQVNIIQVGDMVCGYTWDYTYRNTNDHCKAYFSGTLNKKTDIWFLNGYAFMENSGGHLLMQLKIGKEIENGAIVLKGYCRVAPTFFTAAGSPSPIVLKKISNKPTIITQAMKDCVQENKTKQKTNNPPKKEPKKIAPQIKKPIPPKKTETIIKPTIPVKPIDTPEKIKPKPSDKKIIPKENTLPIQTNGRLNKEISRIVVNDKKIKLDVYDNGTIDGDTVSIFYNGRMIMSQQRLSSKPVEINVTLDDNTSLHSIVLFAENLGSIPPNTALIIFTTPAGKRYELFSSATLQQNAELVFEYKPK